MHNPSCLSNQYFFVNFLLKIVQKNKINTFEKAPEILKNSAFFRRNETDQNRFFCVKKREKLLVAKKHPPSHPRENPNIF